MTCIKCFCFCLALLATVTTVAHGGEDSDDTKVLDPADKQVKKQVITSSQIGYRSTLVFYTFPDQKAVLKVLIGNENTNFPVSATIYTFADDVTDEGERFGRMGV